MAQRVGIPKKVDLGIVNRIERRAKREVKVIRRKGRTLRTCDPRSLTDHIPGLPTITVYGISNLLVHKLRIRFSDACLILGSRRLRASLFVLSEYA